MADKDDVVKKLVLIYTHTKKTILLGEEFDKKFRSFLQPGMEQQRALDHMIRAESVRLGLQEQEEPEVYITKQMNIAAQHIYRGFLDAAEWLSMIIREEITDILSIYSHDCIAIVIPRYYSELRPQVDTISKEIADLRSNKDSEKNNTILFKDVEKYQDISSTLFDIYKEIQKKIPSLEEYKKKEEKRIKEKKDFDIKKILLTVVLTVLFTVASTFLIKGCFSQDISESVPPINTYNE